MSMRFPAIVASSLCAAALVGCSTVKDPVFLEPGVIPEADYTYSSLSDLWALTFSDNAQECVESVPVLEMGWDGSSERIGKLAIRTIVSREMHRLVRANFAFPRATEFPLFGFNATSQSIVITRKGDVITCRIALRADIVDNEEQRKPYFSKYYEVTRTSSVKEGKEFVVPACVYDAVQSLFSEVITDIANDRYCANHLNWVYTTKVLPKIKKPDLKNLSWSEGDWFDGVSLSAKKGQVCKCVIAANDMDAFRSFRWGTGQLHDMASQKLGLPQDDIRIVYRQQQYNDASRQWMLEFEAFPRQKVAINYSKVTRLGDAVADLALLHMDAATATKHLQERVQAMMNDRAGVNGSGAKANVRFYDCETDENNALVKIKFKNVY